ncbi:MAG: glycosyltransferase family 4 protein [Bacteroidales bacterium]|nr:glycosyltransferase family 4 protein [Bacteroidales bacterium]
MRIGVCVTYVSPQTGGGYTIKWDIFRAFVKLLSNTNHDYIIFCDKNNVIEVKNLLNIYNVKSVDIVIYKENYFDKIISKWNLFLPIFKLGKIKTRFEKLALKNSVELMWFVGAGGYFLDSVPYIGMVYDLIHRTHPWFQEVSANGGWIERELFYSWFLRRAFKIITGTEIGMKEIEKFYQVPSERIKILPHPTPTYCLEKQKETDNSVLHKYKIPDLYLFYPAQFWSHKNHVNLLLAIKILKEEYNQIIPVVFVGSDKGTMSHVKNYTNILNLQHQVYFLGFVSQDDIISLYKNAFALVYVSFCGPENLPPLEAFALGCPVIAADIPGAREQLKDTALLVNPSKPYEIALAIKKLLESPQLRETLIQKGKNHALKWTADDFVKGVFEIFDEFVPYRRCWSN